MPFFEMVRAYIKTTSDLDFLVFFAERKGAKHPFAPRPRKTSFLFQRSNSMSIMKPKPIMNAARPKCSTPFFETWGTRSSTMT